jgi:hypothetical protein
MTMTRQDRWIEGGWDAAPLAERIRAKRLRRERGAAYDDPMPASDAMPEGQFYFEHGWHAGEQGRPITEIDTDPPSAELRAIWVRGYAAGRHCRMEALTALDLIDIHDLGDESPED